ncbi:MAG: hypothetical protein KDE50_09000, partial [Caldilineaceae bacterium]|nr:hypothetical protein [Caldilineaceae bacterium]
PVSLWQTGAWQIQRLSPNRRRNRRLAPTLYVGSSAVLGGTVTTINERKAEANSDADGCEHRVKQARLGTQQ